MGHERCSHPRKSLQGHQRPLTQMGKLRPQRRQGPAQGHPASQWHGEAPCARPHHSSKTWEFAQVCRDPGSPVCPCLPRPSRALSHVQQGGREATVEVMCSCSQTGQHIPAGGPLCSHAAAPCSPPPPHTVPIVSPRHFELPLPLASDTAPHLPIASWGSTSHSTPVPVPSPKRHHASYLGAKQ